ISPRLFGPGERSALDDLPAIPARLLPCLRRGALGRRRLLRGGAVRSSECCGFGGAGPLGVARVGFRIGLFSGGASWPVIDGLFASALSFGADTRCSRFTAAVAGCIAICGRTR